jgi:hypothetical protein
VILGGSASFIQRARKERHVLIKVAMPRIFTLSQSKRKRRMVQRDDELVWEIQAMPSVGQWCALSHEVMAKTGGDQVTLRVALERSLHGICMFRIRLSRTAPLWAFEMRHFNIDLRCGQWSDQISFDVGPKVGAVQKRAA